MRLCVIGNSHLGALKDALNVVEQSNKIESVTFFAKGSNGMEGLIVNDERGVLQAGSSSLRRSLELTSNGFSVIDPLGYDAFLVYGLNFLPYFRHSQFISKQLDEAHIHDCFENSLMRVVVERLRKVTDKQIFIGHTPFRAIDSDDYDLGVDPNYQSNLRLMEAKVLLKYQNVTIIEQPLETICQQRKTKPEFSRGSVRMQTGDSRDGTMHPQNDISHMNKHFGELWWSNFLSKLDNLLN